MTQPPPPREPTSKAARQRSAPEGNLETVQMMLRAAGFDPGAADGIPGPATTEAIRRFQAANGLRADGIADEKTFELLDRVTRNPPTSGEVRAARPAGESAPAAWIRTNVVVLHAGTDRGRFVDPEALPTDIWWTEVDVEREPDGRDLEALEGADVVFVVASGAFLFSTWPESRAVTLAVERERAGQARLVVFRLDPVDLSGGPLEGYPVLPADGRALAELPEEERLREVLSAVISETPSARSYLPGFSADSTEGVDLLDRKARVEFLASVLAARQLETPLAVGLFGDWGSGKSFFMRRLQERIVELTEASALAEKDGQASYYCSHVSQVTFNAWLYADSDIWPAFAAQVFRGVAGLESDVPEGEIQAADLAEYQEQLRAKVKTAGEASEREERIRDVEARIEEKQEEIARVGTDVGTAGQVVGTLREIGTRLVGLRSGWRDLRAEDVLVLLAVGLVVLALALFDGAARWIAAVGAAAGAVLAVLRSLDSARRLRAEVRGLEEQLAQERRAQREEEAAALEDAAREFPVLPEFAAREVELWSQRVKLGVVTEIRLKFERLSKLIDETRRAQASGTAKPDEQLPIDRVIVYVDDLDRCHHDVVVSVLETLKLLLSLPHFAVVVGVDSRWLFRSLELHFRDLLRSDDGATADDAWAATPQNYLEKIFQHSVVLKPIGVDGFGRLIDSLMPLEEPPPLPQSAPEHGPVEEQAPSASPAAPEESPPAAADPSPAPAIDLTPGDLRITREELTFMKGLAPMFDTPRSVKRLANVYRLLRVSVGADRLIHAESYEPALLLLSISIAFPGRAGDVFDAIARSPEKTWPELVTEFDGKLGNALRRSSPEAVVDRRLESFAEWIPVVDEFSFHPWRELLPRDTTG